VILVEQHPLSHAELSRGAAGAASEALDVGTDSFDDADADPYDPTEFAEDDDEF
jgi:hypothetical protein